MRMLRPTSNPHARNLFQIVAHLQKLEGTELEEDVRAAPWLCFRPLLDLR